MSGMMKTMFHEDNNASNAGGKEHQAGHDESNQKKSNAIEIRNLNFYYGNFQGLKNINLNIEENQVTAFIGPSGCGKSTLLRTLNRMYDLYPGQRAAGEINLYGENILEPGRDLNLLRSKVGMIFQNQHLFQCLFMTILLLG